MEDCRTPTFTTPGEFKFNLTPTALNAAARSYQEVQNLISSRRSFTPVHTNFRSPDLSPICTSLASPDAVHYSNSFTEFKKPTFFTKAMVTCTPSPTYGDKTTFLSPCAAFDNKFSRSSPNYGAADCSGKGPLFEDSKSSSILNHTLNLNLLLKTLGLERYCENFERAGIDCRNLVDIKSYDLKSIGIKSDEDRNCIMEMFENVFST